MLGRSYPSATRDGNDVVVFVAIAASRFLSLFSVGLGFVAVAWLGASSGSLQLVGQLFFVSSLTTLGVSAFAGASADRGSRLSNLRWAWGLRAAALATLLGGIFAPKWLVAGLFAYSALGAISNSLGASAMDAAFQGAIPAAQRVCSLQCGLSFCASPGSSAARHSAAIFSILRALQQSCCCLRSY